MKLEEGIYEIPDDCTAVYQNRKVIVKKMKAVDKPKVFHCGDCAHQKWGKLTMKNQFWDSPYCENKPKIIYGKEGYFYNASSYKKACEMFEPRENESKNGESDSAYFELIERFAHVDNFPKNIKPNGEPFCK